MHSSNRTDSHSHSRGEFHLICLHGFLGLSTDWNLISPVAPEPWTVHHIDIWKQVSDFKSWSQKFCEEIHALSGTKVLVGYSMGGRLAMHALAEEPDLFQGAMIVSANPGLHDEDEKRARVATDQIWADKFRSLDWATLMTQWNSQNVFNQPENLGIDQVSLSRKESEFDRELLAEAMELWSLGYQRDFAPTLKELEIPILFLTGKSDTKFTSMIEKLVSQPAWGDRPHVIVDRAGHRVPWDAPQDFRSILAKFLSRWYR